MEFPNGGIPFAGLPTRSCVLGFSSPNPLCYVLVGDCIKGNCIFEQAVKELSPVPWCATVKAKGILVEVIAKMLVTDSSLTGTGRIVLHTFQYYILGLVQSRGYPHSIF